MHKTKVVFRNKSLFTQEQARFQNHQSTTQQGVMLSQKIKDTLHKKETVLAVFVDFISL